MPARPAEPAGLRLLSRRKLVSLGTAAAATAAAHAVWPATGATAAEAERPARKGSVPPVPTPAPMRRAERAFRLAKTEIAPAGTPAAAMLVNDAFPGPELRLREGELLRVTVSNALPIPATIHWHGILLPNPMDGVPDVTQVAIPAQGVFVYEYPILQRGTYWYHSHFQFEEQLGLSGPMVIEGRDEPYAYDRDEVLFLSDWMNGDPWQVIPRLRAEAARGGMAMPGKDGAPASPGATPGATPGASPGVAMGGGAAYEYPPGKPFETDVAYDAYLLNGRPPSSPWRCKARRGERIRLRVINGSGSTFFRFAIDGHRLEVIEADGQPVEPVVVDDLVLGTGETYDVLVTVESPGSYAIHAAALGEDGQAFGVLHTPDAKDVVPLARPRFEGRSLSYADLRATHPTALRKGPERSFQLPLGGNMARYLWSIGGQYFPSPEVPDGHADPLRISAGDRVVVELANDTAMFHPMHLHGHFFRLLAEGGDAERAPLKHTAWVAPGQRLRFEFLADNPGQWFFHCHNAYHLAAGMARVFEYVVA